jgi:hypothetical protein
MTNKENFDRAMRKILTVSKAELQRRLDAEKRQPRIGKKRGPKPSASRALGGSGSH